MKRKSFYLMSAALLGALVITSCGQPERAPDLIYRTWDTGTKAQNNEERQLVRAFEKKENVKIKIIETPGQGDDYWTNINASIINKLDVADVFMLQNLDRPLANKYLMNIKEYTDADEEFANVPASVKDACAFKNGVYAIPARLNLQGYFANTTVIEEQLGIDATNLNVNSSFADLENIINTAASLLNTTGVYGVNSTAHFIDNMASVYDTSENKALGHYTWDGSNYHLDDPAFIAGIQKGQELYNARKTLDSYSAEERAENGVEGSDIKDATADAWNKGKLALRYGYTYEYPDMMDKKQPGNSYRFIGNPGGKITVIGDYYGIYVNTKKPDLAYKFAKWMSFGKEGFTKRMEIYSKKGAVNSMPLQNDATLINNYFDMFGDMKGLEDAFEYIKTKSSVEGVKIIPGYNQARFKLPTNVQIETINEKGETVSSNAEIGELLNLCIIGNMEIATYASELNTLANKTYSDWMAMHGGKYE